MNAPLTATLDFPLPTPPAPGTVQRIVPGVDWLRMPLPFALDHINLWLLDGVEGPTIVDCGIANDATRALWLVHFAGAMRDRPVVRIIATHCHPDHLGNAVWLAQRFACPVHMTLGEFLSAHALIDERAAHGPLAVTALFAAHGMPPADVAAIAARGNSYRWGVPEAPQHYRRMLPGDALRAGDADWLVIPGFGHSPEHAALYCAAKGVLIAGDMLLPRISTNVSVWPADPDGDPLGRFLDSLRAFEELPPDTLVLPSHGLPFRGIALRVAQLRAHHVARLAELEVAIIEAAAPVTAASMLPVLFRRELDLQQRYFAMGEAMAHLNYLWHRGRLQRTVALDGAVHFAAT